MAKVDGVGSGFRTVRDIDGAALPFADVAHVQSLGRALESSTAGAPSPRIGEFFRAALDRSASGSVLGSPAPPPGWSSAPSQREGLLGIRALLSRHGRTEERSLSSGTPEDEMLSTLQAMVEARDRLQLRVTGAIRS